MIIFFSFIIFFLKQINSGHISSWDLVLNYNNAGYATEFSLSFSLESGLTSNEYIKLIFPFLLHSKVVNNIPIDVSASMLQNLDGYNCGSLTPSKALIYYISNAYYIQFLDNKSLLSNTFYTIIVKIGQANANLQSSGVKNPIQMFSVSEMSEKGIIYDANPIFATFALNDYPSDELLLDLSVTNTNKYTLNAIYNITLTITSKRKITEGRFEIKFLDKGFLFTGKCESIERKITPIIPKLDPKLYTCFLDVNTGILMLSVKQNIEVNSAYSLLIEVQNPRFTSSPVSIGVRSMLSSINTIIEINQTKAIFQTNPLTYKYVKLYMGWGLDISQSQLYPFNLYAVRNDDPSNPVYYAYNAFKWKFMVNSDTFVGIKLRIVLLLYSGTNSMILQGSIIHNFPSFRASTARCSLYNSLDATKMQIICDNIGQLLQTTEYFIGCRITFPYDLWTQSLSGDFGSLIIYSYTKDVLIIDELPLFNKGKAVDQVQTTNNPNWFIPDPAKYDTTIVSTETMSGLSPNLPGDTILGLETKILSRLVFTLNMRIDDVYSTTNSIPLGAPNFAIPNGAGLKIVMNTLIDWDGILPLIIEKGSVSTGNPTVSFVKYSKFNEITVSCTDSTQLYSMFAYNALTSPGLNYFSISNIIVNSHNSLYPDSDLLDFYIASFEQIDSAFPAYRKLLLYNGYTIKASYSSSFKFGIANYWATATEFNDGSKFPSFIRISGNFDSNEISSNNGKIAIFFNDLISFYQNSNNYNSDEVYCSYSGGPASCKFYGSNSLSNGQSYINLNRVEIDFKKISTDSFQILIPVKTVKNKNKFSIFLSILSANSLYPSNFYKIINAFRLTGGTNILTNQISLVFGSTLTNPYLSGGITTATYDMVMSSMKVGSIDQDIKFSAGHTDSLNAVDKNTNIPGIQNSAGFLIVSSSEFVSEKSVISFTNTDTTIGNQCINGKYNTVFLNNLPVIRYYIFCPYNSGNDDSSSFVSITHGNVPYSNGDNLPSDTVFIWSDKQGELKTFIEGSSSIIPTKASLTFYGLFGSLKKNFKQNFLQFSFKNTNPILDNFLFKADFSSVIQFTLSAGVGVVCELIYQTGKKINHKCVVSIVGSLTPSLVFTLSNCIDCPIVSSDLFINVFGINNPGTNGVTVNFRFRIYSQSGNIIEEGGSSSLVYDNAPTINGIILNNLAFSHLNKRARGPFKFSFNMNGRQIWRNEAIVVNLGGIAKDNAMYLHNLDCRILDKNELLSRLWTSIDISDLTAVSIVPRNDINDTLASFIFFCDEIITPFSYNPSFITVNLQIKGTSTVIRGSNAINIDGLFSDQILFPLSNLILDKKLHNSPGSNLDLYFNITLTTYDIDSTSTNIIIDFPKYYSPRLTNNLLACQINDALASCDISGNRRLKFSYIPLEIKKNTLFHLRIYGIKCPYSYFGGSYFFIGVLHKDTPLILKQHGTVTDIIPDSLPMNIQIFKLDISNQYVRTYSNYIFTLQLPAGSISNLRSISIDFPIEWDLIINSNTPECKIYNPDLTTQFADSCKSFGNRVVVNISQSDTTTNFFYYLYLNNVRNPDYEHCDISPFIVSVLDNGQNKVISRSHPNQINKNKTKFIKNPASINLRFLDDISGNEVSVFQTDIGVFSKFIKIVADFGIFSETITFNSKNPAFSLYSSPVQGGFGETFSRFSIAAIRNTLPGLYILEILKTELFDSHTRLPFLKIQISSNIYTLVLESDTYDVPIGGFSFPIKIYFQNYVPVTEVKVDALFNTGLPGITFLNQTSLIITPKKPNALLFVQSDPIKSIIGTDLIILKKSGTNYINYNNFPNIKLNVIEYIPKSMEIQASVLGVKAINVEISVTCSIKSTLYHFIALNESIPRNKEFIKTMALLLTPFIKTDPYQEQIGFSNYFNEGEKQTIKLDNLIPDMVYNWTGYCEDLIGNKSNSEIIIFRTPSNNGNVYKLYVNYSFSVSSGIIQKIACFFNRYYKLPARYIRTMDNNICLDRRLFQEIVNSENSTNTTNINNSTNSTNNSSNTTNSTNKTIIIKPIYYSYPIYIYPNDNNEIDQVTNLINNLKYEKNTIINWIVNNITGMPSILNISQPIVLDRGIPIFNFSTFSINPGFDFIEISNISLNKPGFFYIQIQTINKNLNKKFQNFTENRTLIENYFNSLNITDFNPNSSFIEIANKYFYNEIDNLTWVEIRNHPKAIRLFLDEENPIQNVNISGLFNETFYQLSFYASCDDPNYFAPKTNIFKYIQNTTNIERLSLNNFILVYCLFFNLIFLLIFF